jgi:hypothetical protein
VMLVDNDALMYPPTKPQKADYVFLESTYWGTASNSDAS